MMTEEKYKEHVKKGWCFAQDTANELASESDLRLHYFLQGNGSGESSRPPTEKQVAYARKLGIKNAESYSKEQLSEKIDQVREG
jgi:hypothetical protein